MILPSEHSQPKPDSVPSMQAKQDVIDQIQSELLALIRVSPDETTESFQTGPIRLGDWSSTLENEISRFLW